MHSRSLWYAFITVLLCGTPVFAFAEDFPLVTFPIVTFTPVAGDTAPAAVPSTSASTPTGTPTAPAADINPETLPPDTEPALYCPLITQTLSYGMKDSATKPAGQISNLQKFLASYFTLDEKSVVSGYFGAKTRYYVRKFQCEELNICFGNPSITGYGTIGTKTRNHIVSLCNDSQSDGQGSYQQRFTTSTTNTSESQTTNSWTQGITVYNPTGSTNSTQSSGGKCVFGGRNLTDTESVLAYQKSVVPAGGACVSQYRVCKNGTLSGTYEYGTCYVEAADPDAVTSTTGTTPFVITVFEPESGSGNTVSSVSQSTSGGPYVTPVSNGALYTVSVTRNDCDSFKLDFGDGYVVGPTYGPADAPHPATCSGLYSLALTHTYSANGNYTIAYTTYDAGGNVTYTTSAPAPVTTIPTGGATVNASVALTQNGAAVSAAVTRRECDSFKINFGDGYVVGPTYGPAGAPHTAYCSSTYSTTIPHTYAANGTYPVEYTTYDDSGAVTYTKTQDVVVSAVSAAAKTKLDQLAAVVLAAQRFLASFK